MKNIVFKVSYLDQYRRNTISMAVLNSQYVISAAGGPSVKTARTKEYFDDVAMNCVLTLMYHLEFTQML